MSAVCHVTFYSLSRKFVQEKKAPPKAQEVIYYSLAIGHHLGVIDCLEARLDCPLAAFRDWIAHLPAEGAARRKLAGVERFGEICIDSSHTHLLASALSRAAGQMTPQQQGWSQRLIALLQSIENEPAIYLMVRRHHG
ncbi:formate hydrogenlyase maturation HycH family protein [Serratia sp. TSA_198.1]|uniref:formate hydrogenlyase maturation HycH family protein n=1 Tax=Serratia sp. TSA_198.1 TaxID=3415664 RepID=UPI0040460334